MIENIPHIITPAWTDDTRQNGSRLSCCLNQNSYPTIWMTKQKIKTPWMRQDLSNLFLFNFGELSKLLPVSCFSAARSSWCGAAAAHLPQGLMFCTFLSDWCLPMSMKQTMSTCLNPLSSCRVIGWSDIYINDWLNRYT